MTYLCTLVITRDQVFDMIDRNYEGSRSTSKKLDLELSDVLEERVAFYESVFALLKKFTLS